MVPVIPKLSLNLSWPTLFETFFLNFTSIKYFCHDSDYNDCWVFAGSKNGKQCTMIWLNGQKGKIINGIEHPPLNGWGKKYQGKQINSSYNPFSMKYF